MKDLNQTMQEAMKFMRTGDLHAATQAIQRGLRGAATPVRTGPESMMRYGAGAGWIDGEFRAVADEPDRAVGPEPGDAPRRDPGSPPGGSFVGHRFSCEAGTILYKLFVPDALGATPPPLIVMLHGCTQSPDDFARGTRMNELARRHGYVVAYPAQSQSRNASRCWNWFRRDDQQRDRGEPAILAALTRHLVKAHALDERRVYVAGLSAGGAMATVLANTYPDVYAAIGVHSGLPFAVAHDLPSALAAMKRGMGRSAPITSRGPLGEQVPAIVFHGDGDMTVDPCNGADVIVQCTGTETADSNSDRDSLAATVERGSVPGGRDYTRTVYTDTEGVVVAEHWLVHGAGHAWFGGDATGSYTDPSGPDASEHMLRFFSARSRAAIN